MADVEVRPVRADDAAALAELLNAIIVRGGTTALETPFTAEALDHLYLTGPEVISCVVAETGGGELLGFQTLVRDATLPEGFGDIGTFARVGATQRGIGGALFSATLAAARAQGLAGLNATIRADNAGGLAFYARMGFRDHAVMAGVALKDGTRVDRVTKRYAL